jgi:histone acetyltransferase MYST4
MAKDANPKDLERWLLEAIGKIRSQKQRPNVERICAVMQQQCRKVTMKDVASLLNLAIDAHKVVRLESKGGVSYRDASSIHKDSKTTRPHSSEAVRKKSDNLEMLVMSALHASVVGCTLEKIEKHVRKSLQTSDETDSDSLRRHIETICSRLVNEKQLVIEDGLYSVRQLRQCKSPLRTSAADSAEGDDQLSSTTSSYVKVGLLL